MQALNTGTGPAGEQPESESILLINDLQDLIDGMMTKLYVDAKLHIDFISY